MFDIRLDLWGLENDPIVLSSYGLTCHSYRNGQRTGQSIIVYETKANVRDARIFPIKCAIMLTTVTFNSATPPSLGGHEHVKNNITYGMLWMK